MSNSLYPCLYQINTRVWMTELARHLRRPATLDDIPNSELDRLAGMGFDWVWLLSVWQTGLAGQRVSRTNPEWRKEFQETLPDLSEEDIPGSGFAITGYTVSKSLGGDAALARLRQRLRQRGLRLMLDFVPNHTGLDHSWVEEHPEYYIRGTELDLTRTPQNYTWVKRNAAKPQPQELRTAESASRKQRRETRGLGGPRLLNTCDNSCDSDGVQCNVGDLLLAHGRDPYFPGWPDTLQLNYGSPELREAMIGELERIAGQCDGVRCDMAMLVLPEVFERTWGIPASQFWPEATRRVREKVPGFCFMAEVYWDMEWTMQRQGFDYAYDKRLYDRLRDGHVRPVREHFQAGLDYQNKLARFLENHDEPRAAAAFPEGQHQAAAAVTFLAPGLRFFHQGQLEGRLKRISPHLGRAPEEVVNHSLKEFYERLLEVLRRPAVRHGRWQLLECAPAWEGNGSSDAFIASTWQGSGDARLLVAVNYAGRPGQCYLRLPFPGLGGRQWLLHDLLGNADYEREGDDLQSRGLYLDVPPWHCHVFEMTAE